MNRREAERLTHQENVLMSIGFTRDECEKLRRISNTLRRWHELECGTGDYSIERDGDEPDSKPYLRHQYQGIHGWIDRRWPIPDRETGARKRLNAIIDNRNAREYNPNSPSVIGTGPMDQGAVLTYIQTDPRGAALYILRPGDVPEGEPVECYYSRGICVY